MKRGIPVTIAGKPNVGKSTLLNKILNEERAIVSEIAGTTRDTIEDTISINGTTFRFIDTAGLRHTTDTIEAMGIERTYSKISEALIILLVIDARDEISTCADEVRSIFDKLAVDQRLVIVINKSDIAGKEKVSKLESKLKELFPSADLVSISAKHDFHQYKLLGMLSTLVNLKSGDGDEVIITNIRHYESLVRANESLLRVNQGLNTKTPSDIIAMDIRQVLHYLGEITGEITTDEVLGSIFSKFCIGK